MGQLRRCKLSKVTGRKPIWFKEIEQIVLEGPSTQKIKPEWQQNMINTLAPRAELLKISIDKRKREWVVFKNKKISEFRKIVRKSDKSWIEIEYWQTENDESAHTTRLKKCKGCQINEGSDSDEVQCILRQQLRSKKRALQNNWVKNGKKMGEFFLEIPLESFDRKRNKVQITGDRPHIDGQQLFTIEIAT
ncbi:7037_t:CDS:1 [Gigaspora rosea]|nr:7037_t:CDS:1 [Gigaspora rosea]